MAAAASRMAALSPAWAVSTKSAVRPRPGLAIVRPLSAPIAFRRDASSSRTPTGTVDETVSVDTEKLPEAPQEIESSEGTPASETLAVDSAAVSKREAASKKGKARLLGRTKDPVRLNALARKMEEQARETVIGRRMLAEDRARLKQMGSVNADEGMDRASELRLNPPSAEELTLTTLVAATAHLGHNTGVTSVHAYPFIYGTRSGISIIDLRQTLVQLRRAANVVRETVENDGIVVFLRGVDGSAGAIQAAAKRLGPNGYAVTRRWLPGTITNAGQVLANARARLEQERADLEDAQAEFGNTNKGTIEGLFEREGLKFGPSLMIVFEPHTSRSAMNEAALRNIPTIGITDTDVDPRIVTYGISANDDAVRSVELIAGVLGRAGEDGLRRRLARERRAAGIDRTSPPRLPFNGALSKSSALRSAMS